jgi:hypothetical protein
MYVQARNNKEEEEEEEGGTSTNFLSAGKKESISCVYVCELLKKLNIFTHKNYFPLSLK